MASLLRSLALVCCVAVTTVACDPRFVRPSNLSAREIQSLSGVWDGQASLSFTLLASSKLDHPCPPVYLWSMRVSAGNVDGDLVDKATPNAPHSRFTTFLDYDGSIHSSARMDGRDTNILGSFLSSGFSGRARNDKCDYVIRLQRTGP